MARILRFPALVVLQWALLLHHPTVSFLLPTAPSLKPHGSNQRVVSIRTTATRRWNWLGDLWKEVIEFSTYGPSERKLLKARRQRRAAAEDAQVSEDSTSGGVRRSTGNVNTTNWSFATTTTINENYSLDSLSLQAFQAAAAAVKKKPKTSDTAASGATTTSTTTTTMSHKDRDDTNKGDPPPTNFDGYALRDLLMAKWGVPLDVDFQRGYSSWSDSSVYVTVMPVVVAFGSRHPCRHETELDYLMHLQAVVEILHRYDNLEPWRVFLETTNRSPKPRTESVPFRLNLSPSALQQILGNPK